MSNSINEYITELSISGSEEAFVRFFFDEYEEQFVQKNLQLKVRTTVDGYWVAETLGMPMLKWIAEKYFNDIFGSHQDSVDIAAIVENAIRRISAIVSRVINEEALRSTLANLNSTQRIFSEYFRAPTTDRLNETTNDSSKVISNLATLGINGHDSYIGATTLRICILQERAKTAMNPELRKGELLNIVGLIEEAIKHHNAMKISWEEWNKNRHVIKPICFGNYCGFWVYRDNEVIGKFGNRDNRLNPFLAQQISESFNNDIYPNRIKPGDEAIKKWEINKKAILNAISENNIEISYILELINKQLK